MSSIFYKNVRLLILTILAIAVWGLSSFFSLPRMEDPELTPRFAVINTQFPGATPERVETLVTDKLEQALLEVEEIKNIDPELFKTMVSDGSVRKYRKLWDEGNRIITIGG